MPVRADAKSAAKIRLFFRWKLAVSDEPIEGVFFGFFIAMPRALPLCIGHQQQRQGVVVLPGHPCHFGDGHALWLAVKPNLRTGGLLLVFVLLMAVSFVVTTLLGVVMAIKYGRSRRAALLCLAFGVAFPSVLILIRALGLRI